MAASLTTFGMRFGDVATMLFTVLLAGEEAVPEDL